LLLLTGGFLMKLLPLAIVAIFFILFGFSWAEEGPSTTTITTLKELLTDAKQEIDSDNIENRIKRELMELDYEQDLKVFDLEIIDGIKTSIEYSYALEPSYVDGYYTRADKYKLTNQISPGAWFEQDTEKFPVYLNLAKGDELIFVRQFKQQKKAILALPMHPGQFPWNSERAIKLDPGTFVSIPTNLNLTIGANATFEDGAISGRAGIYYLIGGSFDINVFIKKDNRVRIKLIPLRRKAIGANARLRTNFDYEVFKIGSGKDFVSEEINELTDRSIKKLTNGEILALGISSEKGNLFMFDYELNLNDETARKIYDHILGSTLKFSRIRVNDLQLKPLSTALISDLTLADAIHDEDKELPNDSMKRVIRHFKGENKYTQINANIKVGFRLIDLRASHTISKSYITYFNKDNVPEYYYFVNDTTQTRNSFFFRLLKDTSVTHNSFMLMRADSAGNVLPNAFSDYGMIHEFSDKYFRRDEQNTVKGLLEINNPVMYEMVDWKHLMPTDETQEKSRIYFLMNIGKTAFDKIRNMPIDKIRATVELKVIELARQFPSYSICSKNDSYQNGRDQDQFDIALQTDDEILNCYYYEIEKIVKFLSSGFDDRLENKLSLEKRVYKFFDLQKSYLFKRIGPGIINELLDKETTNLETVSEFRWSSKRVNSKTYRLGDNPHSELLESLQYTMLFLNNRSFDLRLVGYEFEKNLMPPK